MAFLVVIWEAFRSIAVTETVIRGEDVLAWSIQRNAPGRRRPPEMIS